MGDSRIRTPAINYKEQASQQVKLQCLSKNDTGTAQATCRNIPAWNGAVLPDMVRGGKST